MLQGGPRLVEPVGPPGLMHQCPRARGGQGNRATAAPGVR